MTVGQRALATLEPFSRIDLAIVLFAVPATLMALPLAVVHGRPLALLALAPAVMAVVLRTRPAAAATCIGVSATLLRLAYIGVGYSTQIDHARHAAERAWDGMSPYGLLIATPGAPPEPYVYGPLGLLWWQPGPIVELAAAVGVTILLIQTRSWLTLALYSGLPFAVFLTTTGVNDYSPGLLIASALLLMRRQPAMGAGLLAVAAAVKPYAFAWFLPAIGYGGWVVAGPLVGATALLWSPLFGWGFSSYVRSVQLNGAVHPVTANALNLPQARVLAFPLSLAGLVTRRWDYAVLTGSAVFVVYLFLDRWASLGYWMAVIPIAGIAAEQLWARR